VAEATLPKPSSLVDTSRLVAVGEVVSRATSIDPARLPRSSFRYVDVSAVSNVSMRISDPQLLSTASPPSRARKLLKANDVLFATVRPGLRRVALVPAELDGEIASTGFCVLRPNLDVVDPLYLFYACSEPTFVAKVAAHQKGSSYPAVTDAQVLAQTIPLPPLSEQRAIARVLLIIQRAKESADAVQDAAQRLKASASAAAFAQLRRAECRELALGECVTVSSGGTPSRANPDFWNGDIPWVKTAEIDYNEITSTEESITASGLARIGGRLYGPGTVLIAMYGNGVTRGRAAVLQITAAINQACAALVPNTEALNVRYLYYAIEHSYQRLRLLGHGAHQKNLNAHLVRSLTIPVPSMKEQEIIVERLASIDGKVRAEQRFSIAAASLSQAVRHRLLMAVEPPQ
jgi:type I restriction enzyme, S subunit